MPKPRVLSMAAWRSRARPINRDAALLAVTALVVWPTAVAASDLVTAISPPALEDARSAIVRAVQDTKRGLRDSVESVEKMLAGGGGVVADALEEDARAPRASATRRAKASGGKTGGERTGQAGDERDQKRGDIDEVVASGDKIGAAGAEGPQAARRSDPRPDPLPFTGFDPARLTLAGVTMILAGLALLRSVREGHGGAVARAG